MITSSNCSRDTLVNEHGVCRVFKRATDRCPCCVKLPHYWW